MLTNGIIILNQMIVMSILVAFGYFLYVKNIFDNHTVKRLSTLLSRFVVPSCIIVSFQQKFNSKLAMTLFFVFICAMLLFIISIVLSIKLYPSGKHQNYADRQMCAIFSNNGFMALPLLKSMFGDYGVFLGSAHIVCMTIVLWTYGIFILEGKDFKFDWKKIVLNPGVIAMLIGILIFVSPVKLPKDMFSAVNFLSMLNTPLAMLVLGSFIAQVKLKYCFNDAAIWGTSIVRLLVIPIISIGILYFIPLDMTAKITLLVGMSAPTAVISPMFAQLYKTDYLFSTRAVALSTIVSVITMPLLITAFEFICSL